MRERLNRDAVESLVHYASEVGRIAHKISATAEETGRYGVSDDVASEIDGRMRNIIDDCDTTWFPPSLEKAATAVADAAHLLRTAVLQGDIVLDESLHPINEKLRELSVDESAGSEGTHVATIVLDPVDYQQAVDYTYRAVKLIVGPARDAGVDTSILAMFDLED